MMRPEVIVEPAIVDRLFRQAQAERWGLTTEAFAAALHVSVRRAFPDASPSARELDRYLASLHVDDLALARACALGDEAAWDHFVREHRPILYRAADALDPSGGARELADSLYADLYGLTTDEGERKSLFRYFHGRSSLATWLRAVLSQRHVDAWRSRARTTSLSEDEDAAPVVVAQAPDPDRSRLIALVIRALQLAIGRLPARDRLRLRSYYAVELTLAQIGRITGEHEATVSRHLARTRRRVRDEAAEVLRTESQLSDAEITRGFELAVQDPGSLDVRQLLGAGERKETLTDRSS
jgi:RNA polymerase sigma factor (sigma-70 family)